MRFRFLLQFLPFFHIDVKSERTATEVSEEEASEVVLEPGEEDILTDIMGEKPNDKAYEEAEEDVEEEAENDISDLMANEEIGNKNEKKTDGKAEANVDQDDVYAILNSDDGSSFDDYAIAKSGAEVSDATKERRGDDYGDI